MPTSSLICRITVGVSTESTRATAEISTSMAGGVVEGGVTGHMSGSVAEGGVT